MTFGEHVQELQRRLMWSLLFVAIGAGIGYALHNTLLTILQQPLHEKLYYTTPTGAFSFIIKVCTVFGIIVALPAVLYHGFGFFEPLLKRRARRTIVLYVGLSVSLAALGIAFAYFVSLPASLKFLVNFGSGGGIESLITANEYFNFVLTYIAGFALLFQLPLIITFINRITPLTTGKLMGGTRYVVLGSFIAAAIITPTPDPFNQLLMAGPIILLYFVSACVVWGVNMRARRQVRQKPAAVTPEINAQTISAAAAALTSPAPHAAITSVPVVAAVSTPQPRRVVHDVFAPGRGAAVSGYRQRAGAPQLSSQILRQEVTVPARPARLISDFMPAPRKDHMSIAAS